MENVKCSGFKSRKLKEHHKQFIENLMNQNPNTRSTAKKLKSDLMKNF